jgi:hypothetical protein
MSLSIRPLLSNAIKRIPILVLSLTSISPVLNNARAAETCYNELGLPLISKLNETEHGIKITLRGFYAKDQFRNLPVIYWNEEKGWQANSDDKCISCESSHYNQYQSMIPHIEPIPVEDMDAEEKPSIPAYYDGHIWFGLGFYWGEGSIGTGGIGRYTPATKQLEIRRPAELKRVPIQKVVHDGENLWAATKYVFECEDDPPALGLLKYDWSNNKLTQFKSVNEGPCGFVIHDLVWKNGSLWVATDIGLSRWIKENDQWVHYLPDKKDPSLVVTMSCPAIYTYLFREFNNIKWCNMGYNCDKQLLDNLKSFRPEYYESIKDAKI